MGRFRRWKAAVLAITVSAVMIVGGMVLAESLPSFKDVKGHWAEQSMNNVSQRGLMRGISNDRFGPDLPMTRAQIAAVLSRAMDQMDAAVLGITHRLVFLETTVAHLQASAGAGGGATSTFDFTNREGRAVNGLHVVFTSSIKVANTNTTDNPFRDVSYDAQAGRGSGYAADLANPRKNLNGGDAAAVETRFVGGGGERGATVRCWWWTDDGQQVSPTYTAPKEDNRDGGCTRHPQHGAKQSPPLQNSKDGGLTVDTP